MSSYQTRVVDKKKKDFFFFFFFLFLLHNKTARGHLALLVWLFRFC